jgi:hypothetical protein
MIAWLIPGHGRVGGGLEERQSRGVADFVRMTGPQTPLGN